MSVPSFGMKTTPRSRNWPLEREQFLREIAPEFHFQRVFDGLPGIYFFVKNKSGETLFCSSNLPWNHGMHSELEMVGKTDHDLTPGPLAEKYLADDAEIYRTGEPLPPTVEICIDHVGLPDWYRTCKYPVKNRSGQTIGIMGTFQAADATLSSHPDAPQLEQARLLLTANLQVFPQLTTLIQFSQISPRHFQRLFNLVYGMSPQTYWMKLRIRTACEQISETQLSILQIAMSLGFYDQSSFTKHFRKHTGMTPAAWRQRTCIARR
jgi:AraC-like DNA-binding protein